MPSFRPGPYGNFFIREFFLPLGIRWNLTHKEFPKQAFGDLGRCTPRDFFRKPSQVMFREPVVNLFGNTYEREMYSKALQHRLVDPLTNLPRPGER